MPSASPKQKSAIQELASEIDARLRSASDPKRKLFTEGYFPSAMENLGVAVPVTRKLVAELKRTLQHADGQTAIELVRAILAQNTLEGRNTAYLFLNAHPAGMARLDRKLVEELGRGIDNWTSVDTFGCYVAGPAWRAGQLEPDHSNSWATRAKWPGISWPRRSVRRRRRRFA